MPAAARKRYPSSSFPRGGSRVERDQGQPFTHAELPAEVGRSVRVAGEPIDYRIEPNKYADRIDHLFITLRAGTAGMIEIALNTYSIRNLRRGLDPRVRVAVLSSTWSALPAPGIFPSTGLSYGKIGSEKGVIYREYERSALEELLIAKIRAAIFVEGWGDLYVRSRPGIHQVHSRSKNTAVSNEPDHDGAVRFYFQEKSASELLLLKYFGQ